MSSELPSDPYRPPSLLPAAAVSNPGYYRRRPGWFVTICVISIALGATGFLHSLYAIAEITVGDPVEKIFRVQSPAQDEAELQKLERDLRQEIEAIQGRYFAALLPLGLTRLALTVCLVVGGVGCLAGKPAARKLLVGTMVAALLFELCDSVVQGLVAAEMAEPFRVFGQAMDHQGAGPPDFGQFVMTAVLWGTMCVFYTCQSAKLVFYLGGLLYLRRQSLDPLFEPPPLAAQPVGP